MKYFKNVFLAAVIATGSAVLAGCDKEEKGDDTEITDGGFDGKITATVNGLAVDEVKAVAWYLGDDEDDAYFDVAIGKYANGSFSLQLPATVPAQYLSWSGEPPQGIKISDVNAKFLSVEIEAYNKDGDYAGEFLYGAVINNDTEIGTSFMYADRDINITGSYTEEDDYGTDIETYNNVSLKKGWNKMYVISTESEKNSKRIYKYDYTTIEPSGLYWWFEASSYYQVSTAKSAVKRKSSIFK